jgi:hypothetical protein
LVSILRQDLHLPSGYPRPGAVPAPPAEPTKGERLTLRLLDEALTRSARRGWSVLVLSADLDDRLAAMVEQAITPRGVPFLRVPPKSRRPDLYYGVDGHWTKRGHEHAAGLLIDALLAHGALRAPEAAPRQTAP